MKKIYFSLIALCIGLLSNYAFAQTGTWTKVTNNAPNYNEGVTLLQLAAHMKKEELILFPYIRRMVAAKNNHEDIGQPGFGTVQNPIHMMMQEHEVEGERFRKMSELSNLYTPPDYACNTYKVAYSLLKEFEADLHLHIHLENNILFPKAIELEKESVEVEN